MTQGGGFIVLYLIASFDVKSKQKLALIKQLKKKVKASDMQALGGKAGTLLLQLCETRK